MANLPSSFNYVNDVEVAQDAPVTESLFVKLGSNDNFLRDAINTINGPGPLQSLTTLTSRVNNADNLIYLAYHQAFTDKLWNHNRSQSSGPQRWHGVTDDTANIKVQLFRSTDATSDIIRDDIPTGDTNRAWAANRFISTGNNATNANMTIWIRIFQFAPV
jgi:hypothetical protein